MACLRPVVMAEQKFCVAFFRMDSKLSADTTVGAKTKTQKQVRLRNIQALKIFISVSNFFYGSQLFVDATWGTINSTLKYLGTVGTG